jgi:alpha-tubulin suppressor-like RCC1 family protein
MAFTQITTSNLDNTITTKLAAAEAANAAVANIVSLAISSVQIADSSYNLIDDTAANTGGGYLVINGTGFTNQCVVIVGTTNATSTTFANTKQLRAQVPGLAAASYPLYVVDSVTGATAIKVNGLTYSSFPAWSTGSTLSNQEANTAFAVNLSASSDSSVTYANTTALPAGTTLAANGYFSGTVTIGAQTTYSFDVKATDAENQDVSRTFSLTVTLTPLNYLYAWGFSGSGELGLNNTIYRSSPTQVGASGTWLNLAGYGDYGGSSLASKTDGTLWAWGSNTLGRLGLPISTSGATSSPTQVGTDTTWTGALTSSDRASFAIKTDGTLWSWGNAGLGQLGQGNRVYRSSPVQVGTGTDWSKLGRTSNSTFAIKTDGTLWAWGNNNMGQLGQNNTVLRSSPTQIGTGTDWSKIGTGFNATIAAIKTDGTLWTWGSEFDGILGLNSSSVHRSSPVQVGTGTDWNNVVIGNQSMIASKTNGTLWAWGANNQGQLGRNNTVYVSSPVQVGGNTNWSQLAVAYSNMAAIKTDGTIWIWGNQIFGSHGLNDASAVRRSSPTQIGTGTNWSKIHGLGGGWLTTRNS